MRTIDTINKTVNGTNKNNIEIKSGPGERTAAAIARIIIASLHLERRKEERMIPKPPRRMSIIGS